jgi:hypothetical protein
MKSFRNMVLTSCMIVSVLLFVLFAAIPALVLYSLNLVAEFTNFHWYIPHNALTYLAVWVMVIAWKSRVLVFNNK